MVLLDDQLEDELGSSLSEAARAMFQVMLGMIEALDTRIVELDKEIAKRAREDEVARRLMTITGIGPIAATAIAALGRPRRPLNAAGILLHGSA